MSSSPTPPSPPHILIADADPVARKALRKACTDERYQVSEAKSGPELYTLLAGGGINLMTLDFDLPGLDAIGLLRETGAAVPIMIISGRTKSIDKIRCFDAGARDYMVKPADHDELLARIRSILRRVAPVALPAPSGTVAGRFESPGANPLDEAVTFDGWTFDIPGEHLETPDRALVSLASMESQLLAIFVRKPRTLLPRDEIKLALHGEDNASDIRSIDVLVKKLRAKLAVHAPEVDFIKTKRGVGYFFASKVLPVR